MIVIHWQTVHRKHRPAHSRVGPQVRPLIAPSNGHIQSPMDITGDAHDKQICTVNQSLGLGDRDDSGCCWTFLDAPNSSLLSHRLRSGLRLCFYINLALSLGTQLGCAGAAPNHDVTTSGMSSTVDTGQEIKNNHRFVHGQQDSSKIATQPAGKNSKPLYFDPTADGPTLVAPELYEKAKALGLVRVIVEFRLPEHRVDSDSAREEAIRVTQKAIVDELANANFRVIRSYASIPSIVIAASVDALKIIAASRYTIRVTEDSLSTPSKP